MSVDEEGEGEMDEEGEEEYSQEPPRLVPIVVEKRKPKPDRDYESDSPESEESSV